MLRNFGRRSSPCQGRRERLLAYLGGLLAQSAARLRGCEEMTGRAELMLGASALTLLVMLGPLNVPPDELAAGMGFIVWQFFLAEAIRPGQGGRP